MEKSNSVYENAMLSSIKTSYEMKLQKDKNTIKQLETKVVHLIKELKEVEDENQRVKKELDEQKRYCKEIEDGYVFIKQDLKESQKHELKNVIEQEYFGAFQNPTLN